MHYTECTYHPWFPLSHPNGIPAANHTGSLSGLLSSLLYHVIQLLVLSSLRAQQPAGQHVHCWPLIHHRRLQQVGGPQLIRGLRGKRHQAALRSKRCCTGGHSRVGHSIDIGRITNRGLRHGQRGWLLLMVLGEGLLARPTCLFLWLVHEVLNVELQAGHGVGLVRVPFTVSSQHRSAARGIFVADFDDLHRKTLVANSHMFATIASSEGPEVTVGTLEGLDVAMRVHNAHMLTEIGNSAGDMVTVVTVHCAFTMHPQDVTPQSALLQEALATRLADKITFSPMHGLMLIEACHPVACVVTEVAVINLHLVAQLHSVLAPHVTCNRRSIPSSCWSSTLIHSIMQLI